jgi:transposase
MQWPQIGRLMTVPGVNLIVAATFLAAVGDIRRFPNTNKLVGYLGLDPRVRQSGDQPAKHGRISKQGSAHGRHALVEAAWSAVRQPGPLRAFYQRVRARRGHQIAIVASAGVRTRLSLRVSAFSAGASVGSGRHARRRTARPLRAAVPRRPAAWLAGPGRRASSRR